MKKFVAVILTSLVVLAIADRAVGALLEHLFRTTSSGAIGRQNELLQDDVPQVAVFGSSRALHHYVPSVIAKTTGMTCRNYGLGGQGIFYHYVLMRTLTARKMPRAIVYELTYDYDVATSDPARELAALRLLPPSAVRDSMLRALDCWEAVRSLSRSYAYNTQPLLIMADRVQHKPTSDDRGYVAKHGQMEEGRAYSGRDFDTEHTDSMKLNCLQRMLAEYGGQTRLLVVVSPLYRTNRPDVFAPIAELCSKWSVPFIDMSGDKRFSNSPELFEDPVHLNDTGARKFSAIIAEHVAGSCAATR